MEDILLQLSRWISAILAVSLLMLVSCDKYDQTAAEPLVIILDPGHGGEDPGAIGGDSVYEKDLNLSICRFMRDELLANGYTVVMTRDEDKMLYTDSENIKGIRKISDLKNRVKLFNSYGNAVVISIHMNSFSEPKYHGTQIYCADSEEARLLATFVRYEVRREIQPDNRRPIKGSEGIYLLEHSENPTILVECGFLSNEEECAKLSEKDYQKRLSFALVCGIIKYIEEN